MQTYILYLIVQGSAMSGSVIGASLILFFERMLSDILEGADLINFSCEQARRQSPEKCQAFLRHPLLYS